MNNFIFLFLVFTDKSSPRCYENDYIHLKNNLTKKIYLLYYIASKNDDKIHNYFKNL